MEIICLANSFKGNERCIAGIDPKTGRWVRPISQEGEGAIDFKTRQIGGKEPQLLDGILIPVQGAGPDYGCQPENVLLQRGAWKTINQVSVNQIVTYCENDLPLLHDNSKRIPADYFTTIPRTHWKSLQLVNITGVKFVKKEWPERVQYLSRFSFHGQQFELSVTDPIIRNKLAQNIPISDHCIITVSLTSPYENDNYCYKLVASVIEL